MSKMNRGALTITVLGSLVLLLTACGGSEAVEQAPVVAVAPTSLPTTAPLSVPTPTPVPPPTAVPATAVPQPTALPAPTVDATPSLVPAVAADPAPTAVSEAAAESTSTPVPAPTAAATATAASPAATTEPAPASTVAPAATVGAEVIETSTPIPTATAEVPPGADPDATPTAQAPTAVVASGELPLECFDSEVRVYRAFVEGVDDLSFEGGRVFCSGAGTNAVSAAGSYRHSSGLVVTRNADFIFNDAGNAYIPYSGSLHFCVNGQPSSAPVVADTVPALLIVIDAEAQRQVAQGGSGPASFTGSGAQC